MLVSNLDWSNQLQLSTNHPCYAQLSRQWLMRLLAKQADEKLKEKSDVC
jgi:hypothetical protein